MSDMTLESIRDFIGLRRLKPSELFSEESITADPVVRNKIKAEFDMRERLQKEFEDFKKEGTTKVTGLETENKTLKQSIVTGKAQSISQAIITERKMPEPKAKFVTLKMPEFKIEGDVFDDAAIKGQLNKFIDKQIDEFGKLETVFNPGKVAEGDKGNESGAAGGDEKLLVEQ